MKKLLTALLVLLFVLNMGAGLAESEPVVIKMMVPSDHLEFMNSFWSRSMPRRMKFAWKSTARPAAGTALRPS